MIRTLEQRLDAKQPFDRIREQILVLKPLAASAVGRKTASELFKQFIDFNVELAVKSEESFTRGFIIHMQSVVAYLKYSEEK